MCIVQQYWGCKLYVSVFLVLSVFMADLLAAGGCVRCVLEAKIQILPAMSRLGKARSCESVPAQYNINTKTRDDAR